MKSNRGFSNLGFSLLFFLGLLLFPAPHTEAQSDSFALVSPVPAGATASFPSMIKLTGSIEPASGLESATLVGMTFSIYESNESQVPVWSEVQNVEVAVGGRYTVLLGNVSLEGIPPSLFVDKAARWLEVSAEGYPEQPRALLVSVPYAIKAADADTLGGHPSSHFATVADLSAQAQLAVQRFTADAQGNRCLHAPNSEYCGQISGPGLTTKTVSGSLQRVSQTTCYAHEQAGANAGAKIAACIADLPSTGGTVDARGFEGKQTISSNPFSGVTKPVKLLLGGAPFHSSVTISLSGNYIEIVGIGTASPYLGTGATTIRFAAGVTGFDITGNRVVMQDLFVSSASVAPGTDDGIRVRGPGAELSRITVKGFGRHGVLTDSSGGRNSNFWNFGRVECYQNRGDGFKWTGGSDANVGMGTALNADSNTGLGYNFDVGASNNVLMAPHAAFNTGGAFRVATSSNYFLDVYVENGTGSSFKLENTANNNRIWFASSGQPTQLTPNASGPSNIWHYTTPEGLLAQSDFFIAPSPSALSPTTYSLRSGHMGTGAFSLRDDTNRVNLFRYDPGGNPLHFLAATGVRISNQGTNGASLAIGAAASTAASGDIRLHSQAGINFRNNSGSADVNGLSKDSSDVVQVGGTAGMRINGGSALTTSNQTGTGDLVLGTSPALTTPNIGAATGTSLNLGGATLQDVLTGTATLDFKALAANSCEVLTVTVKGAADGDDVRLGVPNALADVDGATERTTFFGWVSAADTVSVRRCNNTPAATADPAVATVRATVSKF